MMSWLNFFLLECLVASAVAQINSDKDVCAAQSGWAYAYSASSSSSSGGGFSAVGGGERSASGICVQAKSPQTCIRAHSQCAWCAQTDFSASRCDLEEELSSQGCKDIQVVTSATTMTASQGGRFSHLYGEANIRIGDTVAMSFAITEPQVYPVDFYYLMDFSYSMREDLERFKLLGDQLVTLLESLTGGGEGSVQLGFGKFVDKVQSPMTQMTPYKLKHPYNTWTDAPFLYKNVVKLTSDVNEFKNRLKKENVSGNLDPPEGALDAMLQVVQCKEVIGWRTKALRLLMIATESSFHYGGDGAGFLGGISKSNDGACHTGADGSYVAAEDHDYPTINQVVRSVEQNSITPIFAVADLYSDLYKTVSEKYFRGSTWGVLEEKSTNVLNLVEKAYKDITGKQELVTNNPAENVLCPWYSVAVAGRDDAVLSVDGTLVENLELGSRVNYTLHLSSHNGAECEDIECALGYIKIKTRLYDDVLNIKTNLKTAFDCAANIEYNSSSCFNQGHFSCGICTCISGWTGTKCNILDVGAAGCVKPGDTQTCSGRGTCVNNRCQCDPSYRHNKEKIFGDFCECDDCLIRAGLVCSSNGRKVIDGCSCSCECKPGWSGHDCSCDTSTTNCIGQDGEICSGHGHCQCGICVCDKDSGYGGPTCSTCLVDCPSCDKFQDCVQCTMHQTGPKNTSCATECAFDIHPTDLNSITEESTETSTQICAALDASDNCKFYYKYEEGAGGVIHITAEQDKRCKPAYSLLIVLWCILLVLLIGLILLCCWRCCIYVIDKEEEKNYRLSTLARYTSPAMVPLLPAMGAGNVIEFIKAKYLMRRSAKVAVIPVRRSFFNGKTSVMWKTYAGSAQDDDFEVLSGGEEGTLARKQKIERVQVGDSVVEMEPYESTGGGNGTTVSSSSGMRQQHMKSGKLTTVNETSPLLEIYDWGNGELEFSDSDEFASIEIPLTHEILGREIMFWVELYGQEKGVALGLKRTKVIVIKDEDAGNLGFPKPSYVFKENDNSAIIPVHRTVGMDGEVSVSWFTRDITAIHQQHYHGGKGVLNFKDGEVTKHIEIELIPDIIYDDTEKAFNVQLEDPKGGATLDLAHCMVTVLSDEECALLQFPKEAYPFMENCGIAEIPVIRTRSTKGACTVKWRTEDATAIAGKDYEFSEGILSFPNSVTEAHIKVPIIDNDVFDEAGRAFRVVLYDPSESTKLALKEATISIIEDDEPGMFEFAKTNIVLKNTGSSMLLGHLPLIRSLGTDSQVNVPWIIQKKNNQDIPAEISSLKGSVQFNHGEITNAVDLNLTDIPQVEMMTFEVVLLQPSGGGKLGANYKATVTIFGEEDTGSVSFAHSNFQTMATSGMATLLVSRKGNLENAAFVMCETHDKTAISGTHYRGGTNSIVFETNEAAKEIGIPVYNDPNHKGQLVFTVSLKSTPGGPRIGEIETAEVAITCVAMAPVMKVGAAPQGLCNVEFIKSKYLARKSAKFVTIPVHRTSIEGCCAFEWGISLNHGGTMKKMRKLSLSSSSSSSSDEENALVKPVGKGTILDNSDHCEIRLNLEDFDIYESQMSVTISLLEVWWEDKTNESIALGLKKAEVVILNDIDAGTIGFLKATFSINARDGVIQLPVHRLGGMDGDVSAEWCTRDKTAIANVDYKPDKGVICFANNQIIEHISVKLFQGNFSPSILEKQFTVELGDVTGGAKTGIKTATVRVIGEEDQCIVQFSKASYPVIGSSNAIKIAVLRTGDCQNRSQVQWYTEDGTAKQGLDYKLCHDVLTFEPESTREEIEIPLSGKTSDAKTFKVILAVREGAEQDNVVLGTNKEATVAIVSSREPGTFEFSKPSYVFQTKTGSGLIPVVRSNGTDGEITLPWRIKSCDDAMVSPFAGAEGFLHFEDGQISASVEVGLQGVPSNSFVLMLLEPDKDGKLGSITSATVTIIGDAEEPTIQMDSPTMSLMTNEVVKATVIRCGNLEETTCVGWKTEDGSAVNGKHFIGGTGNLVLNPGEERSEIIIPVLCPPTEGNATFYITLTDARGFGTIGDVKTTAVTLEPMPSKYMDVLQQSVMPETYVEFLRKSHHFQQSQGTALVPVHRSDTRGLLTIRWETKALAPKAAKKIYATLSRRGSESSSSSEDEEQIDASNDLDWGTGAITFEDGEREAAIELVLYRELQMKESNFLISLVDPWDKVNFGVQETLITVIKDRDPGCLEFINPMFEFSCNESELVIPVNRTSGADGTVSVPWFTRDGTAIGGTHYLPDDGNLVFRDGDVLRKIRVPMPRKTAIFGEDEVAFEIILGEPTGGAVLGKNSAIVLLKNDTVPSLIGFPESEYSSQQSEGVVAVPVIRTQGTTGKVEVPWRATSVPGKPRSRFEASNDVLTFKDNEEMKMIEFPLPKGLQPAEQEFFILELENPKSGRAKLDDNSQCCVTIHNDISVGTFSLSSASYSFNQSEGRGCVTVSRCDGTEGEASLSWKIKSALSLTPQSLLHNKRGVIEFNSGQVESKIEINLPKDSEHAEESFVLTLSPPGGRGKLGEPKEAEILLTNDVPSTVEFVQPLFETRGDVDTLLLPVIRSGPKGRPVAVNYQTIDDTAKDLQHFIGEENTLQFNSGEDRKDILIPILNDPDGDRVLFEVLLHSVEGNGVLGANACATVAIDNLAGPGIFIMALSDMDVNQSSGKAVVTILRTHGRRGYVELPWFIEEVPVSKVGRKHSAYDNLEGKLSFADGEGQKQLEIPLEAAPQDDDETKFSVILLTPTSGSGATLGDVTSTKVSVNNDIDGGTLEMATDKVEVLGTDKEVNVPVVRTGATDHICYVAWEAQEGTAIRGKHFKGGRGNLSFEPGERNKKITIPVINDPSGEVTLFEVVLGVTKGGAKIGERNTTQVVLDHVRENGEICFAEPVNHFKQSQEKFVITVLRKTGTTGNIIVPWKIEDANEDSPYYGLRGQETFKDGENESHIEISAPVQPQQQEFHSLRIVLEQPSGGAFLAADCECSVQVENDVLHGVIAFSDETYDVKQSQGELKIPVNRSIRLIGRVRVPWKIDSDKSLGEFTDTNGIETFEDGQKYSHIYLSLSQLPSDTDIDEFHIQLDPPKTNDARLGELSSCVVRVHNDILPAMVGFCEENHEEKQSKGKVCLPIERTQRTSGRVIVPWKIVTETQDSPYFGVVGETVLEDGDDEGIVEVHLPKIALPNDEDVVTVVLEDPIGAKLAHNAVCPMKITNDMGEGIIEMKSHNVTCSSEDGQVTIIVTRKLASDFPAVVEWQAENEDAISGSHYNADTGSLSFRPGESERPIHIPLHNDPTGETRHFKIKLVNVEGRDKIGSVSQTRVRITNEATPPNAVRQFEAALTGLQSVKATWEKPLEGAPVEGYKVTYWSQPGTSKTEKVGCEDNEAILTNLDPGTSYQFLVRPYNDVGDGPPSNTLAIDTPPELRLSYDTPIQFKTSQQVATFTLTRNITTFESVVECVVAKESLKKLSKTYNSSSSSESSSDSEDEDVIPVKTTNLYFEPEQSSISVQLPLKQNMKRSSLIHHVRVYNPDRREKALANIELHIINDTGVPGHVRTPFCASSSPHECVVSWEEPIGGGPVKGYRVTASSQSAPTVVEEVPAPNTNVTLQGLQPSTEYSVTVQPYNDIGFGKPSAPSHTNTQDEMKIEFSERFYSFKMTDKVAVIPIKRHYTHGYSTLKWQTQWAKTANEEESSSSSSSSSDDEDAPQNVWSTGSVSFMDGDDTAEVQIPLKQATSPPHKVKKQSFFWLYIHDPNRAKRLGALRCGLLDDNPRVTSPRDANLEATGPNSIQVTWNPQDTNAQEYWVSFKRAGSREDPSRKITTAETGMLILEDLEPESTYAVVLTAVGEGGKQASTEVMSCTTPGNVPGPPNRLAFQVLSPTSLQCSWGEPANPNGLISSYEVMYHSVEDESEPPILVRIPDGHYRSLLVEELKENHPYRYSVRAKNKWGYGPFREADMTIEHVGSRPPSAIFLDANDATYIQQQQYLLAQQQRERENQSMSRENQAMSTAVHSPSVTTETTRSSEVKTRVTRYMHPQDGNEPEVITEEFEGRLSQEDLQKMAATCQRIEVQVMSYNTLQTKTTGSAPSQASQMPQHDPPSGREMLTYQSDLSSQDSQRQLTEDVEESTDVQESKDGDSDVKTITTTRRTTTVEQRHDTKSGMRRVKGQMKENK